MEISGECWYNGDSYIGIIGNDNYSEKTRSDCCQMFCSAVSVELTTNEQWVKFQFGNVNTGVCSKYQNWLVLVNWWLDQKIDMMRVYIINVKKENLRMLVKQII